MHGFVYFIETDDRRFLKIGHSLDPYRRSGQLGTLRPGPFSIRLLGCIPGTVEMERQLHARFAIHRDKGEWFRVCPEIQEFVASLDLSTPTRPAREIHRVQRFYRGVEYREDPRSAIARAIRASGRAWWSLVADINRVSRGTCQSSFLWSVYRHTAGDKPKAEYTPVLLPEDYADEGGFTPQQMREEIKDAVLRGLVREERAGSYRYRLLSANWPSMPNAIVFRGKRPRR